MASSAFISVMIKEVVEHESVLQCNNVEKAFQSKDSLDTLQKPFNTDQVSSLCLLICPHGDVENRNVFIPSFSAKYFSSFSPVQTLTMCLHFTQAGRKKNEQCMENVLWQFISANVLMEVTPKAMIKIHVGHVNHKLTGGPWDPFCPGGPGAPIGTSP